MEFWTRLLRCCSENLPGITSSKALIFLRRFEVNTWEQNFQVRCTRALTGLEVYFRCSGYKAIVTLPLRSYWRPYYKSLYPLGLLSDCSALHLFLQFYGIIAELIKNHCLNDRCGSQVWRSLWMDFTIHYLTVSKRAPVSKVPRYATISYFYFLPKSPPKKNDVPNSHANVLGWFPCV